MSEILPFEEIQARYAPDWVLLGDVDTGDDLRLRSGRVLLHGPDADELYRKAGELMPGRFAVRYLGTRPEAMVMTEVLPFEEIKARFAPDWVLMGDITTRDDLSLVSGRVLFHTPDQEEVWQKAAEFMPGRLAVRYLGTWPKDMEYVL